MERRIEPYGFTTKLDLPDVRFREVREAPFDIYGLYNPHTEEKLRRMPDEAAAAVSPMVRTLSTNTAGGRVRFCTDSDYIAIHADMPLIGCSDHFPRTGAGGFDLYVMEGTHYYYYGSFRPGDENGKKGYEQFLPFASHRMRHVMIHFPLYSNVTNLYIGLQENATLDHGHRYRFDKPVVYYGSSITQGGCASHPGNAYQAIIANDLDCDFINLGFSGAAKGEQAMSDYIASLDMSVFVMDYDHNATSPEYLKSTHETMFRTIRAAHPTLPIVMITAPNTQWYIHHSNAAKRHNACRAVIFETYQNAVAAGDENVWYIDGDSLFEGRHHDLCTVDGCHPTDAGFIRMADRIGHVLGSMLR